MEAVTLTLTPPPLETYIDKILHSHKESLSVLDFVSLYTPQVWSESSEDLEKVNR